MISDAFSIYGSNLGALLLTGLGIAVVFGIVVGILNDADSFILQLIGSLLQLVAAAIYTGFVVKLVQDVRDGKRDQSVGELISSAMPALGSLIVFSVLSSIAIMIGFFLLIIPGLILLTIWSVGAPSIVAEGRGPIEAFGRSYDLVRGQTWTVFGVLVVVFLILIVAFVIVGVIGAAIGGVVGAAIVSILVMLLYMPICGPGLEHAVLRPRRRRELHALIAAIGSVSSRGSVGTGPLASCLVPGRDEG